jgi:dienelactone hydrolase
MSDDPDSQRAALWSLLGDLPPRDHPISATTVATDHNPAYHLERLVFDLNGIEPVPALYVRPHEVTGPLPVVLYTHAHGGDYGLGKTELTRGRDALQSPPYAELLTSLGYAALCIDHWAFGERRGRTEAEIARQMLWDGRVMWGMMVYDSLRALDWLASHPDHDPARIAAIGISMGSTMSWWLAALDERVACCIDLCCLTDFDALVETGGVSGHGEYYYVPGLRKHTTAAAINALIAPRPHLGLAGIHDRLTPAAGLDRIDRELTAAYAAAGAPEAWRLSRHHCGHLETAAMRAEVIAWLTRWC